MFLHAMSTFKEVGGFSAVSVRERDSEDRRDKGFILFVRVGSSYALECGSWVETFGSSQCSKISTKLRVGALTNEK